MSQILKIDHFVELNIKERGQLDADANAGTGTSGNTPLVVVNNNGIAANDTLYLGNFGGETGEAKAVASVSGATGVTLSAVTSFKHVRFENFAVLFGNQIKVYRAANVDGTQPADSAFAALGSPTTIDYDQPSTSITDASGSDAYWYKSTFYNSTSLAETNLADSKAVRGGESGNYCTLDAIRREAGFTRNTNITNEIIDQKRQAAQQTINGALLGVYTIPFTAPINPLIADMTARLAAGWLLLEQYGHFDTRNTNNGQSKVDSVTNNKKTGDLDKLQIGSMTLVDTTGTTSRIADASNGFNGWPDESTAEATKEEAGGGPLFRIGGVDPYDRDY